MAINNDPGEALNMGESATAALLIIDMINPLDFDGAAPLAEAAAGIIEPILKLRSAADAAGLPIVYVNDNHGEWHAEPSQIVDDLVASDRPGSAMAERLRPRRSDYFVTKPQLSGFYATTLAALLPRLGVSKLILVGIAADLCVLLTAADAHMREYALWVPSDAIASDSAQRAAWAVDIMKTKFHADTRASGDVTINEWLAGIPNN
jgi:nicotinamidase-related amidase